MKYVVHVGPHKTGSTYLQFCFKASQATLAARGILFPELWRHSAGTPSHHGLAERLRRGEVGEIQHELAGLSTPGIHTILISSEDLSSLDESAIAGLRQCLGDAQVVFVFYVRRWSALVPSSWQELVKGGNTMTLPEFVLLQLRNPHTTALLNWERKLAGITAAFGRQSIRLVAFDMLRQHGLDLFTHFAKHFLAWPGALAPEVPLANPSRDIGEITLLRAINAMAHRDGLSASSLLRNRFDQRRALFAVDPILGAMEAYRKVVTFHDDLPPLRLLQEALFDALEDRLVEPRLPHRLFKPERNDLPYVSCDFLGEPGTAALVRAIYEKLRMP